MANDNNDQLLNSLFKELVKDVIPEAVITNFIIIAEVVSDEGTDLSLTVSPNLTPWLALGMTRSADQMIVSGECKFPQI